MNFEPVAGDFAGNDLKWAYLQAEVELYLRTGNYALLRDVRLRQAKFCEAEGEKRIALSYYCYVYYGDLNGFRSMDELLSKRYDDLTLWKSTARVDVGIVNKIFALCAECEIDTDELLYTFCQQTFIPRMYGCHLFTIQECRDILLLARDGKIGLIDDRISHAEACFRSQFTQPIQKYAV
jgi:hypothetical protein